jgi:hypothetical protein
MGTDTHMSAAPGLASARLGSRECTANISAPTFGVNHVFMGGGGGFEILVEWTWTLFKTCPKTNSEDVTVVFAETPWNL